MKLLFILSILVLAGSCMNQQDSNVGVKAVDSGNVPEKLVTKNIKYNKLFINNNTLTMAQASACANII
jgi:hypothetical protein